MSNLETIIGINNETAFTKLNICLISREYPLETGWGGIGNYTYNLAHGLSKSGCQVHVIAQSPDVDRDYLDGNVHVHRIAHKTILPFKGRLREFCLRLEYSRAVYEKLKGLINNFRIDIAEAPNFSAEGFACGLFKKIPLITRLHTHFSEIIGFSHWPKTPDRRLSCLLEESAILRSNLITCSTRFHAEAVSREIGMNKKNVEIIPLGVPLPAIKADHNHGKMSSLNILFVGRLEIRKGVHVLIKAIPHVIKNFPDATFNIIGRDTFVTKDEIAFAGDEKSSFKFRLINEIPTEFKKNVNFLGYVPQDNLAKYYQDCDIFVAPSLYESFGLIYIEAMSYAKPVIGCGVGGIPEVVKDQETGILVPPEDHLSLARAVIRLLEDSDLRRNMGIKARASVEKNFSRELMVERTLQAYKRVLKT